jgi:predicted DNA-binding WGR domain protein
MRPIRLESIDPERNRFRFYTLYVGETLWSEIPGRANTWAVVRTWGRIGQRARGMQIDECANQDDALHLAAETIELRMRHGYTAKRTHSAAGRHGTGTDDTTLPRSADP